MTFEENVEKALFARAESLPFAVANPTKVAWPNKPFNAPADGSAYVEVAQFPNRGTRYGLPSDGSEFNFGFLQLLVRAPRNAGYQEATKIAGELALHFPADLKLYSEGVRVKISKRPDVMSASPTEASWNVPVTVYYEAFA